MKYLIAYSWSWGDRNGTGRTVITREQGTIETEKDIKEIEKLIEKKNKDSINACDVNVVNIVRLPI